MENIAKSMLEKCVFTNDPIIGGIPMIECINKSNEEMIQIGGGNGETNDIGLEQFKDLVVPIGLFLDTVNDATIINPLPAYDDENEDDDVISDKLFDRLFDAVTKGGASKTSKRSTRKKRPTSD